MWQIIGHIFGVDGRCRHTHSFRLNLYRLNIAKFNLKELETSFYGMMQAYFDILNHLSVNHKCDRQTDGQTDILIENTALHYVA